MQQRAYALLVTVCSARTTNRLGQRSLLQLLAPALVRGDACSRGTTPQGALEDADNDEDNAEDFAESVAGFFEVALVRWRPLCLCLSVCQSCLSCLSVGLSV